MCGGGDKDRRLRGRSGGRSIEEEKPPPRQREQRGGAGTIARRSAQQTIRSAGPTQRDGWLDEWGALTRQSGSPGNCRAPPGMMTPGSFRVVHMCTALVRSTGSSNEPPLMLTISPPGLAWWMRVPQATQNVQSNCRPLSVDRRHAAMVPCLRWNALAGTRTEMPNADADCLRHSWQWHT